MNVTNRVALTVMMPNNDNDILITLSTNNVRMAMSRIVLSINVNAPSRRM